MFKKLVLILSFISLLSVPQVAVGQEVKSSQVFAPYPWPRPILQTINVNPRNPLDLRACGVLEAKGKGWAKYNNFSGHATSTVRGAVAIKLEDLDNFKVEGFHRKSQRGSFLVYHGNGKIIGQGRDLDFVTFGQAKLESKGCGHIQLAGRWGGSFQYFPVYYPVPAPEPWPLPVELQELQREVN